VVAPPLLPTPAFRALLNTVSRIEKTTDFGIDIYVWEILQPTCRILSIQTNENHFPIICK